MSQPENWNANGFKRDALGRVVSGQLNPGGRPKTDPLFRARCRKFVDEHVVRAWCDEVTTRGKQWLEASRLLAAYGYGAPKPLEPAEETPDGQDSAGVTPAAALSALLSHTPRGPDDSEN